MDRGVNVKRVLNAKDEKQSIYEIYRACRLCGAGAGYKMPIIQSVVDLETDGLELKDKIKECVQIEVSHTDRMPPLICELCVDKVNDFYEFLNLCQRTNKRTRTRLGLPMRTDFRSSPDCENCILGVTERLNADSDAESVSRPRKTRAKVEPADAQSERAPARRPPAGPPDPPPPESAQRRVTRQRAESAASDKSALADEAPLAVDKSYLKRSREKDAMETPPPNKKIKLPEQKVKTAPKPSPASKKTTKEPEPNKKATKQPETAPKPKPATKKDRKPSPPPAKSSKTKKPDPVKPKASNDTSVKAKASNDTSVKAKASNDTSVKPKASNDTSVKSKASNDTSVKLKAANDTLIKLKASNDTSVKAKASNDTPVKPKAVPESVKAKLNKAAPFKPDVYKSFSCEICGHTVKSSQGLFQHMYVKHTPTFTGAKFACNACELWFPTANECQVHHRSHALDNLPYKCLRCYGYFKEQADYERHFADKLCLSSYEVPDVSCWRCARRFPTNGLLAAHRCGGRPGAESGVDSDVQSRLLPMQVRISRCDGLIKGGRANVATLPHKYGLDSRARYPYLPTLIKREASTKPSTTKHMVTIDDSVKAEFNWDSDSNDSQKVDSLSAMTLKTINKSDSDANDDLAKKIFSIIDNLGDDAYDAQTTCDSDSLLKNGDGSDEKFDGDVGRDNSEVVDDEKRDDKVVNDVSEVKDGAQSVSGSDSVIDKNNGKGGDASKDEDEMEVKKAAKSNDDVTVENLARSVSDVKSDETNADSDDIDKMDVDGENVDLAAEKSDASSVKMGDGEKMDVDCEGSDVADRTDDAENVDVNTANSDEVPEKCSNKASENTEGSAEKLESVLDERLPDSEDGTVGEYDQKHETDVIQKDDDTKSSTGDVIDDVIAKIDEKMEVTNDNDDITNESDDNTNSHDKNEQNIIETSKSKEAIRIDEDNLDEKQYVNSVQDNSYINNNLDSSNQSTQDCILDINKDKEKLESNTETKPDSICPNDIIADKTDENNENCQTLVNNEVFSKIDEITNKILKESEDARNEHNVAKHPCDPHSDSISLNSLKSDNDVELRDKFNVDDLCDDDKRLMAELDAQIGEINRNDEEISRNDEEIPGNNEEISKNDEETTRNDEETSRNDEETYKADQDTLENGNKTNQDQLASENNYNAGFNDKSTSDNGHTENSPNGCEVTDNQKDQNGLVDQQNENGLVNDQRRENDQRSKDYLIDNLLRKQDDLGSLELDSISDEEFNFDA